MNPLLLTYGDAPLARRGESITMPDVVTMVGFGLGLWWSVGGPASAGIASIVLDEVDGRLARATNTTTEHGYALDWGQDVALTPLALARLTRELGYGNAGLVAAPPVLLAQSMLRSDGWRPPVGSARAAAMIAAIAVNAYKNRTK